MSETTVERMAREHVAEHGCAVCEHPFRELIEAEIYMGRPNGDVANRYRVGAAPHGAGGAIGEAFVREHRRLGHMPPRQDVEGRSLVHMREKGEARIAAAQEKAGQDGQR